MSAILIYKALRNGACHRDHTVFSERELTFTFAIYAISVPSVCPLSVCNVGAPYSAVEIFGNFSSAFRTLTIP